MKVGVEGRRSQTFKGSRFEVKHEKRILICAGPAFWEGRVLGLWAE